MKNNKTSEALETMAFNCAETLEEITDRNFPKGKEPVTMTYGQFLAAHKKYKKMEEALGQIRQAEQCKLVQDITNEALEYDPLDNES